jgi:antirestriction protein ArdC
MSALSRNFAAPIWMTYRQASDFNAHVRKGENGSLVVYANAITLTEHDDKTGEDVEHEIPYRKGYTVFNVEQIEGLPEIYYAKSAPTHDPVARIDQAEKFLGSLGVTSDIVGTVPITRRNWISYRCRRSRPSAMPRATTPPSPMN